MQEELNSILGKCRWLKVEALYLLSYLFLFLLLKYQLDHFKLIFLFSMKYALSIIMIHILSFFYY